MLKKDTMEFLEALEKNNNRDWFATNKDWYERAKADFELLVTEIAKGLPLIDPEVGQLEPKKCIFRIYRDVRFSSDKSPYKTHFGAGFRPKGMDKSSGYYLHVAPNDMFLSCGHYMLTPDQLKKVRRGIYQDFDGLQEILNEKKYKKEIGDLFRDDDMLKRVPNEFDKEHPAAEYLRLKHFYALKTYTKEQLLSKDFASFVLGIYKQMYPLSRYLNDILTE